jgi:hypothetical protein
MNLSNIFSDTKKAFNQAPLELRLFAFFSILATLFGLVIAFTPKEILLEKIIPFTGWSPGIEYMFSLILTTRLIFFNGKGNPSTLRFGIVFILSAYILLGIQGQFDLKDMQNSTNPYLRISEYNFIWTILIPFLWALIILFSPNINKFCDSLQKKFV